MVTKPDTNQNQGMAGASKSLKSNKVDAASSPIRSLEIPSEQASAIKSKNFLKKKKKTLHATHTMIIIP